MFSCRWTFRCDCLDEIVSLCLKEKRWILMLILVLWFDEYIWRCICHVFMWCHLWLYMWFVRNKVLCENYVMIWLWLAKSYYSWIKFLMEWQVVIWFWYDDNVMLWFKIKMLWWNVVHSDASCFYICVMV